MLHWQVLKLLSRISLEARVLICSFILHLFLLLALFVVYQGSANFNVTISGNILNPDAEIVFMPLHRSIKQGGAKGSVSSQTKTAAKNGPSKVEKTQENAGTTLVKIVQPKPKAKTKKESRTNGSTSSPRAAKKVSSARPEPAEGSERNKKTELAKQQASPQKDEETKPEPAIVNTQETSKEQSSTSSDAIVGSSDNPNIVYVGQEEMDSLQAQEYIQQELAQHWAPPAGMRSDLQAIITLTMDFEGNIKQVELTQASGNLLFDTAAKKAAAQITPARWAYGKKFAITFKP